MLDGYFQNGEEFMAVLHKLATNPAVPVSVQNYKPAFMSSLLGTQMIPGAPLENVVFRTPREVCDTMMKSYNRILADNLELLTRMNQYAIACHQEFGNKEFNS